MSSSKENIQELLDIYQSRLFSYAYNIVGDSMEAEDVVRDVLNKYILRDHDQIRNPEHYLIRSVINLSINRKKLLRNQMESYPGHWLPGPVSTEESIYQQTDRKEILNYSLMVLLENLNPRERSVFILKESFDYSHNEIAELMDIRTESSRQLLKRAKTKLSNPENYNKTVDRDQIAVIEKLTNAILHTNMEEVKRLLTEDIQSISDGGSKQKAARNILVGKKNVSKFMQAIFGKYMPENTHFVSGIVNHRPSLLFYSNDILFRCIIFEITDQAVNKIFIVVNQDKLKKTFCF